MAKSLMAGIAATVLGGVILIYVRRHMEAKEGLAGMPPVDESEGEFYA